MRAARAAAAPVATPGPIPPPPPAASGQDTPRSNVSKDHDHERSRCPGKRASSVKGALLFWACPAASRSLLLSCLGLPPWGCHSAHPLGIIFGACSGTPALAGGANEKDPRLRSWEAARAWGLEDSPLGTPVPALGLRLLRGSVRSAEPPVSFGPLRASGVGSLSGSAPQPPQPPQKSLGFVAVTESALVGLPPSRAALEHGMEASPHWSGTCLAARRLRDTLGGFTKSQASCPKHVICT